MARAFGGYGERVTESGRDRARDQARHRADASAGKPALLEFITAKETRISQVLKGGRDDGHVSIRDVRKSFGTTEVLHGVSIEIADGEFVVLVGPSGCGKARCCA